MSLRNLIAIAFVLYSAACSSATQLDPAGGQPAPAGPGEGAIATNAGVQVEARSGAWRGDPATLEEEVTPLLLEIANHSGRPMLVRYSDFKLISANGKTYEAMPPFDIEGEVTEQLTVNDFPYRGFTVAPYLRRYYPRLLIADPFLLDRAFYTRMTPLFRQIRLPTGDMVQKALPEGVLAPGGKVVGFVYFQDVDDDDANVTFSTDLVDATSQARFGEVRIPFVAH